jgi:hypothetical protein
MGLTFLLYWLRMTFQIDNLAVLVEEDIRSDILAVVVEEDISN